MERAKATSGYADGVVVGSPDVAFDDPELGIHDDSVRDHEVERALLGGHARRLAHAVAQGLAAPEHRLVTVRVEVSLDLDDEPGVGEVDAVARGRAVEVGVFAAGQSASHTLTAPFRT